MVLLLSQWTCAMLPVGNPISRMKDKTDVLQGTLALMVLKTLDVLGPCTATASLGALSRLAEIFSP
jgi:hypothetical protein